MEKLTLANLAAYSTVANQQMQQENKTKIPICAHTTESLMDEEVIQTGKWNHLRREPRRAHAL